jgi:hypothetical protein
MAKVEGSNPFIRFLELADGFCHPKVPEVSSLTR